MVRADLRRRLEGRGGRLSGATSVKSRLGGGGNVKARIGGVGRITDARTKIQNKRVALDARDLIAQKRSPVRGLTTVGLRTPPKRINAGNAKTGVKVLKNFTIVAANSPQVKAIQRSPKNSLSVGKVNLSRNIIQKTIPNRTDQFRFAQRNAAAPPKDPHGSMFFNALRAAESSHAMDVPNAVYVTEPAMDTQLRTAYPTTLRRQQPMLTREPEPVRMTGMQSDRIRQPSTIGNRLGGKAGASKGVRVAISNLSHTVSADDIQELCSTVGSLISSKLLRAGEAEAIFATKEDAEAAIANYDGRELDGVAMQLVMTEDSNGRAKSTVSQRKEPPRRAAAGSSQVRNQTSVMRTAPRISPAIRPSLDMDEEMPMEEESEGDYMTEMIPETRAKFNKLLEQKKKTDAPEPDRSLISQALFAHKKGSTAPQGVTFTVKI